MQCRREPTGPTETCGAKRMPAAWAKAASFFPIDNPPQWQRSGCAISTARNEVNRANSSIIYNRSPAAMRKGIWTSPL